jgi:hypothetical protein
MQRRTEPLTPLGEWLMMAGFALVFLAIARYAAGGWRGLLHPRLRGPLVAMAFFAALGTWGGWLVGQQETGQVTERATAIGGTLLVCSIVAFAAALLVAWSRFTSRWEAAARITGELTELLDEERQHFQVEHHNMHQPLALLEELTDLIGPGSWAPGHEWATHQWIADRLPAALALKPDGPKPRIENDRH